MERICPKCGGAIEDGDSFCETCGIAVEEAPKKPEKSEKPVKSAPDTFLSRGKKKLIVTAAAVVVIVAAVFVILALTANTPEGALRKAVGCRLDGSVEQSAALDYDSNFNVGYAKEDALAAMKADASLTGGDHSDLKLMIRSENKLIDEEPDKKDSEKNHFTERVEQLAQSYRDTERITDIRTMTYDLLDSEDEEQIKASGTAEAIKVDGKWYILGVARAQYNFS